MANLYEILNVSPKASQQEIRSAFRRLARLYHPDVNPSPTATDDFLRIAGAYRVLSDRRLRSLYDRGTLIDREEYLRRKARQQAMERYFDEIVDQLLRRDYEETRARRIAVTTVVSLFFSTFIFALLRPPLESLGLIGWFVCLILFGLGVRELVKNVRFSLKHYTFDDESTISLMGQHEAPQKPFTREEAWAFLIGGYIVSLGLGLLVRRYVGEYSWMLGNGNLLLCLFFLPPIALFFVSRLQGMSEKYEFKNSGADVRG